MEEDGENLQEFLFRALEEIEQKRRKEEESEEKVVCPICHYPSVEK